MIDIKRDKIQNSAVDSWELIKRGTCNVSTGIGKTFIFFKAVVKSCKPGDKILFLAETRQREIDLFVDLDKFERLFDINLRKYNIQFDCYQSAYKWENTTWDFVCGDEIHCGLTPSYSKFFLNNNIKYLLGLSATVDRSNKYIEEGIEYTKGELLDKIAPVIFTYTLNQAIEDNTAKKLNIYLVNHELDKVNKVIKGGTKDKPFFTTEQEAYNYWDSEFKKALFLPDGLSKTFRIRNTSAARAKILYNLPSKIEAIKVLLNALKGKTIIFGNSIDALKQVTPNVIHGKNSEAKNKELRKGFDEGTIKEIASFKMLEQGANLSHLDNTILASYYSKELALIQRFGRQRVSDNTGNVFIFVTNNTQEQKWLNKSMSNITNYNIIKCNDIQETIKKYTENQSVR